MLMLSKDSDGYAACNTALDTYLYKESIGWLKVIVL